MAFLDKLMFWKKGPEFPELEPGLGKESGFKGAGGFGEAGFGKPGAETGKGFEQLGLGKEPGLGTEVEPGLPGIEQGYGGGPGTQPQPRQMQRPPQQWPQQQWPQQQAYGAPMTPMQPSPKEYVMSKDIEIVSSKLDALKATLDGINQRLANLERIATQEKKRW